MSLHVLIFAHQNDIHARAVAARVTELSRGKVAPLLVDGATFPIFGSLDMSYGRPENDRIRLGRPLPEVYLHENVQSRTDKTADLDMGSVIGIWWRRFRNPVPAASLKDENGKNMVWDYAYRNTLQSMKGLVVSAGNRCKLINDPFTQDRANLKPFQLKMAEQAGLRVASTLISNDPDSISGFVHQQWAVGNEVIYKSVTGNQIMPFTQLLEKKDLNLLSKTSHCPTIFQQRIQGFDVRVAATESRMFALAEHSDAVDVRRDIRTRYERFDLCVDVAQQIRCLQLALGLSFASYDFKCDADGNLWFLEVNPGGQWLWMETDGGFPISAILASMLLGESEFGAWQPYRVESFKELASDLTEECMYAAYERAVAASRSE